MKTKFTLLIAVGLLITATSMAQGYDRHDDRNDYSYQRHDHFDYRTQMFNLQQQLNHELNELDRARQCGDWEKAGHEKREIAEIRSEIRQLDRIRYFNKDDYRSRDYHDSRF